MSLNNILINYFYLFFFFHIQFHYFLKNICYFLKIILKLNSIESCSLNFFYTLLINLINIFTLYCPGANVTKFINVLFLSSPFSSPKTFLCCLISFQHIFYIIDALFPHVSVTPPPIRFCNSSEGKPVFSWRGVRGQSAVFIQTD